MRKAIRAFISILATMLLVSAIVFALESFSLGDSSSYILAEDIDAEELALYRSANNLDRSIVIQYLIFLKAFCSFDWGMSVAGMDIKGIIFSRFPITLALSLFSLVLSLIISMPLAIFSASKRNGRADKLLSFYSIVVLSLPSFLIASILILLFSFCLKLFPISGYIPIKVSFIGFIHSLFLPSLTLAIFNSAFLMRMFRECFSDNLDKPYTLALKAQGASGAILTIKSAMKPAMPVIISLIVQNISVSISGSAIVESVFALPGIGSLLVRSVLSRDVRLSGTIIMLIAFIVSLLFLISDFVSIYLEPRLRREE